MNMYASLGSKRMFRIAWVATNLLVVLCVFGIDRMSRFDAKEGAMTSPIWWGKQMTIFGSLSDTDIQEYSRAYLARRTLQHILNQTVTINGISISPPCQTTRVMTESTSSLLLATALTKAENLTQNHPMENLWSYFDGLFRGSKASASRGFLPRYTYPVKKDTHEENFAGRLPNWPLFVQENPCQSNKSFCWLGSGRISAMPFHGTVLLELLLQLQRRPREGLQAVSQRELHQLVYYWECVFDYHEYLHEVVMRGCDNYTAVPCYNMLHPWESLLEKSSLPSLKVMMQSTLDRMNRTNWEPTFEIPAEIQSSYDFDESIFRSMLFLNECLVNETAKNGVGNQKTGIDAVHLENRLIKECEFAMLDVGYASALAQSDRDLRTVGMWLSAQNGAYNFNDAVVSSIPWDIRIAQLETWGRQNNFVMNILWHPSEHSFQSQYALPPRNVSQWPFPTMQHIGDASANNLMVFWKDWDNSAHDGSTSKDDMDENVREMVLQLLSHTGGNSFDCDTSYPLWTTGCNSTSPLIDPRINYFVGLGLLRNKDSYTPFGEYLTNATIKLICSGSWHEDDLPVERGCARNLTHFQEIYAGNDNISLHMDTCGNSSVATASILIHLLWDDFDFTSESPLPPIRNSWVIILITAELMIAFMVGVSCVLLSLNIVRRENNEDSIFREDAATFDPLMQVSGGGDQYTEDVDDIMSSS